MKKEFKNLKKSCNNFITQKTIEAPVVQAVTSDKNQAKLSILDVPDVPGIAAKIFTALSEKNINVDMIVQSAAREGYNDISFTLSRTDLKESLNVLENVSKELKASGVIYDNKIAKVSIVGVGMKSYPGVAAKMFTILAKNKINIEMISTSEIKISCIIKEKELKKAVKALSKNFKLTKD